MRPKLATPRPIPRLYLTTPLISDVSDFLLQLTSATHAGDVAAVLLRLADSDERTLINRAKAIAATVQEKDAALLLDGRVELVARAGADGAHLTGITAFTEAITHLKPERIAGAGGLATRHDAMLAAEQGADYVMFGEPDTTGARPAFNAIVERVAWWSEVFEIPCVAYAGSLDDVPALVEAGSDFIALGDFLWRETPDIAAATAEAARLLRMPEPAA